MIDSNQIYGQRLLETIGILKTISSKVSKKDVVRADKIIVEGPIKDEMSDLLLYSINVLDKENNSICIFDAGLTDVERKTKIIKQIYNISTIEDNTKNTKDKEEQKRKLKLKLIEHIIFIINNVSDKEMLANQPNWEIECFDEYYDMNLEELADIYFIYKRYYDECNYFVNGFNNLI